MVPSPLRQILFLGPTDLHTSEGPVRLQYHHNAVRYRSVWVRPLAVQQ